MKRQGTTGIWTYVTMTPEGKVLAFPDWSPMARTYEWDERYWMRLPIVG